MNPSMTMRAWQVLRDMTINVPAVTIKAWRAACPFLTSQRFWDARSRLLGRGLVQLRGELQSFVRVTPDREPSDQPRRTAQPRVRQAPGRCPVCEREGMRLRPHAILGRACYRCTSSAYMLRDGAAARQLADMLDMLA